MVADMGTAAEPDMLDEIRGLTQRIHVLRSEDARLNAPAIKLLEAESRAKWEQLRQFRAGPIEVERTPERRTMRR
jgi:hypothetical protein